MAIHRGLRKAARAVLSPFRKGREALARRRKNRRIAQRVLSDQDVDQRLSAIARQVESGRFVEVNWQVFRSIHFPALSDDEMADVLGDWCRRHGFEPTLREGNTETGGKVYNVVWLLLTRK